MPFLDKLTDKFGEMMKEKLSGGGKEESSEQFQYSEHQKESEHGSYGNVYSAPPPGPGPPGSNTTLPPGWLQQWDSNSQRYYYLEQATGRTQWEPPASNYGASSDMHHLSGSVPGQYYNQEQKAMYPGGDDRQHYEGEHSEEKKDSSHTGLALAGGVALGAVGGAWAAHEYTEHEEEEKHAAEMSQYQANDSAYASPLGMDPSTAPPPVYIPEDADSDVGSAASSVHSAAEEVQEQRQDVAEAQGELAEASDSSDREEAAEELEEQREELGEAREDYVDEREDLEEEVRDD